MTGGAGGINDYYLLANAELYDPATGTFGATRNMTMARADGTATLLQNGKVLIAGGDDVDSLLLSAELYDPAAGKFTATGNMTAASNNLTATLLQSGKVLIVSGDFASAELYE